MHSVVATLHWIFIEKAKHYSYIVQKSTKPDKTLLSSFITPHQYQMLSHQPRQLDIIHEPTHPQEIESKQRTSMSPLTLKKSRASKGSVSKVSLDRRRQERMCSGDALATPHFAQTGKTLLPWLKEQLLR
ncbi:hypothetical protein AVEN_273856-1 [Araneus ventricosus]|uniref:Uncharacterized protein n=1 Tax=Araneus ventricosus TaxID=182803 RepID=A0A4Y2PDI6_ARAVE|nr:hypothetical protein AVEN_273856-1 [Araneus ventricosus]